MGHLKGGRYRQMKVDVSLVLTVVITQIQFVFNSEKTFNHININMKYFLLMRYFRTKITT
jgi:hypothetical protein